MIDGSGYHKARKTLADLEMQNDPPNVVSEYI